jgi:hypothetical protein
LVYLKNSIIFDKEINTKAGGNSYNTAKIKMSKTITLKKTLNGNYVSCIKPIPGQQSSEVYVKVFDKDFKYMKSVEAHPLFTWVSSCETIATIYAKDEINEISEILKLVIENQVTGYTTAFNLRNGKFMKLLPPMGRAR